MRLNLKFISISIFLTVSLAACNLPVATPNAAATLQGVYTAQASTVEALQTQARVTLTPMPSVTFPTLQPLTPVASITPLSSPVPPTAPPQPTRTLVSYCDWASFVKDVSYPDGSVVSPGMQFTKTWRLKNIGTCTWTTSYGIVFMKGDNMNGEANTKMPETVRPGETVDISIVLTAPASGGSYRGYWVLRNKAGEIFGLGGAALEPFFVDIKVTDSMSKVFDFTANYCDASWRTGTGPLACPGDSSSDAGFVIKVINPQLENGQMFSGPSLYLAPEKVKNGYLQGYYPAFDIKSGDRFRATINCAYLADGCNAIFRLDYQVNNGPVKTLWQYTEAFDQQFYAVDVDLSSLDGNPVNFILTVLANGSADNDKLIWAGPRIDRLSNLVTGTPLP
ncbi:MAG TPA: NBR1-Ig-like domain-containing protein [Anaerolineales bacterium]|jgi:hypothetical protein